MNILRINKYTDLISEHIYIISICFFKAPKEAYRPPCARGQNITFRLHDDIEPPSKPTVECKYVQTHIKYFIINSEIYL